MRSSEVLRKAVNQVGAKSIAADMNLSTSLVYKWCQPHDSPDSSGAENPLDRLIKLYELTGDRDIINWLCQRAGGFLSLNPDKVEGDQITLISSTQRIVKEFSELLQEVSVSLANDGRIDAEEAERIRGEWEDLKQVAESFVIACEEGSFNKSRGGEGVADQFHSD